MNKSFIIVIFTFFAAIPFLSGQDDHGHTHAEEGMENAHLTSGIFSVYAETQKYELTLKHGRIDAGEESDLTLYIADFKTNRPLANVDLKITVQEDPSIIVRSERHDDGIYHLHANFKEVKPYSLAVNLNSKEHGADLLLLNQVEIGKDPPAPEIMSQEETHEHGSDWWKFALVFFGGLAIGYFLLRRRPKVAAGLLIVVCLHGAIEHLNAHGGHGDEEEATAGNVVLIPKETQFLFNVLTQQLAKGEFQPAVDLFATVIPAAGGFAEIMSPQSGKITGLSVVPGQKVGAGQTLAIIRPSTTLSEQVGVATETGRLRADINAAQAELNAAERELNRLRSISDIAAKKDIQAAEARYNTAKANLESLRAISSGGVTGTGTSLVLKAPVSGTVGQFSISQGSEIMAGTTLFSVFNLDKVYLEAQVYGEDAALLENAKVFQVTTSADERTSENIRIISAGLEVNPSNQSRKVIFELENKDNAFKIGEYVTVHAFLPKAGNLVFIPNSALSEINGKPVVFIKSNPEQYLVRYVSLGEDNGTHSIVLNGMDEGERYVTEGTYQVKMMMLNQ